jgi:DNA-binding IclR family transcriptional regulator
MFSATRTWWPFISRSPCRRRTPVGPENTEEDAMTAVEERPRKTDTVAVIERAASILSLFGAVESRTLGVTEIANALGISKTGVFRILSSLRKSGFIDFEESTRRYLLGPKILELGLQYLQRFDVREPARDALRDLSAKTDETSTLSVRSGSSRVYIEQVTPSRAIKMVVVLGQPYPLHAGASSKALLAFLPEDEIEEYLATDIEQVTTDTVVVKSQLREELSRIRENGYAVSFGERQVGAGSVAAPILGQDGVPVASMSVCGPIERFAPNVEEFAILLLAATGDISARLGYRP